MLYSLQQQDKKYYVYRFLNKDKVIIYVGRTGNLYQRFLNHSHLTDSVKTIEYIECDSEAEMAWKEIYYINLYYNELSTNVSDVYLNGNMKDIGLKDEWIKYNHDYDYTYKVISTKEKYFKYVVDVPKYDYKSLIHIVEHEKLNEIGKEKHSLSQKWFRDHKYDSAILKLKNNLVNFFRNLCEDKSNKNIWTTYEEFREDVKGSGYSKGFIKLGFDSSDDFSDRKNLAYLANNFYPTSKQDNFEISEDQFAISELLQFIFNSAIRNGEEIYCYIPSIRMRNLLKQWINENSLQENENQKENK